MSIAATTGRAGGVCCRPRRSHFPTATRMSLFHFFNSIMVTQNLGEKWHFTGYVGVYYNLFFSCFKHSYVSLISNLLWKGDTNSKKINISLHYQLSHTALARTIYITQSFVSNTGFLETKVTFLTGNDCDQPEARGSARAFHVLFAACSGKCVRVCLCAFA